MFYKKFANVGTNGGFSNPENSLIRKYRPETKMTGLTNHHCIWHTSISGQPQLSSFQLHAISDIHIYMYHVTCSECRIFSGLLVAYLTMKEMQKRDGRLNWVMFYFHRFWRQVDTYLKYSLSQLKAEP